MKVSVVTPLFSIAGVPLAQVRFAQALANRGHEVDLVIGKIYTQYDFPPLSGVRILNLRKHKVRGMIAPLFKHLLKAKPDVVFSAEDHLNAVVLAAAIATRSKAKISCSSRVTPFDTYSDIWFSKRWWLKQIMRLVMWRADALTCVSRDMVKQYQQVFKVPTHVAVYNIVDDRKSRSKMLEPVEHDWFTNSKTPIVVAAGRLAPWKGFDTLIQAMAILVKRITIRLVILGDGDMREELEVLISDLGLDENVCLQGYVDNPLKYFSKADVFVLSSLVEGLPNVLVEAMMCGCTPVSTDCPTGPKEVLQEGKYGYLVPIKNPSALADGIEQALDKPIPPEVLAEAVRPFEESEVLERHFEALGLAG